MKFLNIQEQGVNNYYVLLLILTHLSIFTCQTKPKKVPKPRIEQFEKDSYSNHYFHHSGRRGLDWHELLPGGIIPGNGYAYNDTPTDITFWMCGTRVTIKPYAEWAMLPMTATNQWTITFGKLKNGHYHETRLNSWLFPGFGDYGVIIKKDDSGITDLTLDVVPKKELDALKAKRAKELKEKVGGTVYEVGVKSKPVANIVAEYVGTDLQLPEE